MLVLSRKLNEKIRNGKDIVINVVQIADNQVKIGIEAPSHVKILREEIYEDVKKHTIEASKSSAEKIDKDLSNLLKNKLNKKKK